VTGATRSLAKAAAIERLGARAVVVDAFDAEAVARAVKEARPEILIHQLTDLNTPPTAPGFEASLERNARLRVVGTPNLMAAAKAAGVTRVVAQSIAFVYAPGSTPHVESDPLDASAVRTGAAALEEAVLGAPGIDGIVLRYGFLYGPDTWTEARGRSPALHVDAAAHAAMLAVSRGAPGIYNVAEDDGAVSIEKARRELGFDPSVRIPSSRPA
jgi:nucleoside-diphosphate-sugar epimerase